MAAVYEEVRKYSEVCTVAVVHVPGGRGANEDEITDSLVQTLRRLGYDSSEGELLGFGASAAGAPDIPLGLMITMGRKAHSIITAWIERRRQKLIKARWPLCVVQLVVSFEGEQKYERERLASGILAVLPALLEELQQKNYQRRYRFMIFTNAPGYSAVRINLDEEDVKSKYLVRMINLCESGEVEQEAAPLHSLDLQVRRVKRWLPRKVERLNDPGRGMG